MESNTSTVSQIAVCLDCGLRWEDYINHRSRKSAYAHAKKTGHKVVVETALATTYNPRKQVGINI